VESPHLVVAGGGPVGTPDVQDYAPVRLGGEISTTSTSHAAAGMMTAAVVHYRQQREQICHLAGD
jgi:hypothetical protein